MIQIAGIDNAHNSAGQSVQMILETRGFMRHPFVSPNAAVERRRAALSSAPHVHNEMAHLRRARDDA